MPRQQQSPDQQIIDGEIRFGTSLWRVNDALENLPLDQESSDFYAGDLRDVCGVCDPNDKVTNVIRGVIKGKPVGELVNLPCKDVKQLVAAAKRGIRTESAPAAQ